MKGANFYLNFAGNTEEAFKYYKSVFGGDFVNVIRFRDFPDNTMGTPEDELDRIAHIALPLGNNLLMGTDVVSSMPTKLIVGNNFYITLEADTADEADTLFQALSSGGSVEMALERTEWSEKYGSCVDRFGVQWMVDYTGSVTLTAPFAG